METLVTLLPQRRLPKSFLPCHKRAAYKDNTDLQAMFMQFYARKLYNKLPPKLMPYSNETAHPNPTPQRGSTQNSTQNLFPRRGGKKHRWRDVPLFPETNKPFFPKNKCSLDINRLCLSEEHLCLCLGQCKLKLHTTASSPTWSTELWQTFNFYLSQTTHNIHSFLWCYKSTPHWDFRRSATIPQTIFSSCHFAYWSGIDNDGLILH